MSDWPACPRDGRRLVAHLWLKTEFGRCEYCRGILISGANWNQLLQAARFQLDQRDQRLGAFSLIEVIGEAFALLDW